MTTIMDAANFFKNCDRCGKKFQVRKMAVWQKKIPANCSKSCASTAMQEKRWTHLRLVKKCAVCEKEFTTMHGRIEQTYCGRGCLYKALYNNKEDRQKRGSSFVSEILTPGSKIARSVNHKLWRICQNLQCYHLKDDIFQDWILKLLEGQFMKLQHSAMETLINSRRSGPVLMGGKYVPEDLMRNISGELIFMSPLEIVEILHDIQEKTTPIEFGLIVEMIKGSSRAEALVTMGITRGTEGNQFWSIIQDRLA